VDVVRDDILTQPQADRFQVPPDFSAIHLAAALGATLARAQIEAPSLEVALATAEIIPQERGDIAFSVTGPRLFKPPREIALDPGENMQLYMANDAGGADEVYGLVWFKKPGDLPPMPDGKIIAARVVGAQVLVPNVWTSATMVLEKELPAGQYALVGFHAFCATGIAARALIPGQTYRPGVPCIVGATEGVSKYFDPAYLSLVNWYEMGRFANTAIPQMQFLASAADTDEYGVLYLVKVG
jgi:hypothetical protein